MESQDDTVVAATLQQLAFWQQQHHALVVSNANRLALGDAIERAASQLLQTTDNVLTIALAGCSGAGKSTLINALAGAPIARTAEERPCTNRIHIYHHKEVVRGGLPTAVQQDADYTVHERPELRYKVIVDTPDLDTFATANRAAAKALLKSAGLVIYVFSPERYWEERSWSVIREEQRFSAAIAVLNKVNTITTQEAVHLVEEIRQRFIEVGSPAIRVLQVAAIRHTGETVGDVTPSVEMGILDEFMTLRAEIEHELQEGDLLQMRRQQRLRVIDHLASVVDHIVPADLETQLDEVQALAETRATVVADTLVEQFLPRIDGIQRVLLPMAALRRQQLFWGPVRLWFVFIDFLYYGLPRLIRQVVPLGLGGRRSQEGQAEIAPLLVTDLEASAHAVLHAERMTLQDTCFAVGLPIQRWQNTTLVDGPALLLHIAQGLSDRVNTALAIASPARRVAWVVSFVGTLLPVALLLFALFQSVQAMATLDLIGGYQLLGLALTAILLGQILLGGLAGILVPPTKVMVKPLTLLQQVTAESVRELLKHWVALYRGPLEHDAHFLRQSVTSLRDWVQYPAVQQARFGAPVLSPVPMPPPIHAADDARSIDTMHATVQSVGALVSPPANPFARGLGVKKDGV